VRSLKSTDKNNAIEFLQKLATPLLLSKQTKSYVVKLGKEKSYFHSSAHFIGKQ